MDLDVNNKTGFRPLGQTQIIAKTILIICGIGIALLEIIRYCITLQMYIASQFGGSRILGISYIVAVILATAWVIYYLIINNDWLIKKIVPDEEPIAAEYQKLWFISCLRVGLVFCGLLLMAYSLQSIVYTVTLIVNLPFIGKQAFSDMLYGSKVFKGKLLPKHIYDIITTVLIVYLIAGAPGFVKWQMKRSLNSTVKKGEQNE